MVLSGFLPISLIACTEASGEWDISGDAAKAGADIRSLPFASTLSETQRLLRDAPEARDLTIGYYGKREDRLGNDEGVIFYTARFDGHEIAAADFSNIDATEAAALAQSITVESREGAKLLANGCPFRPAVCETAAIK